MSGRLRCALAGVVAFLCVVAMTGSLAAQTPEPAPEPLPPPDPTAPFFDDSVLHEIRLRIHTADWKKLIENYGSNTYYPCDMVWRDQVVRNVGVRSRGSGSRNPNKPGFRVDFDRYAGEQQFLGLKSFVLDNLYQDPALMRERVTMKFYQRMGLPAPREAFVKLFVNEEYIGVYAIVESIDKDFLSRVEGLDRDGYIFEYKWNDVWWFTDLGSDYDPYIKRFEAKTHEKESTSTLYDPIEQFVRTVNAPHDILRDVGEFLSIRLFLRQLAVEAFVAEWDGIIGDFGINNFYLYRKPTEKEHRFVPWDRDNAFKGMDYPVWPDGMNLNVLTSQLMNVDELRTYYLDAILECVSAAEAREGEPGPNGELPPTWLEKEIETQYQQILAAVRTDPRKPMSNEAFDHAVQKLRDFATFRPGFVRDAVANRRRELAEAERTRR